MNLAATALAAVLASASAAQAAEAFKPVRADETYAYLATANRTGLDVLRYIPVGGDAYLTLGGEARLRIDAMDAPRFGVAGEQADTYGLVRGLFSADLHLNDRVRIYGELGLHRDVDKTDAPASTDRNGLDTQVAFVDVTPDADRSWRLRLGRQELMFSPTQRFVSVREGPNIRQSFDGLRVTRQTEGLRLDAFYVTPVTIAHGAFNDPSNRAQHFYGVYAASRMATDFSLDVYALALDRDGARFGAVTGDERRRSLGARLAGRLGAADFEAEGIVQRGAFAGRKIRAWAGSIGGGYTLAAPWKPRIGLRLDAGSGDKDPNDGRLQTFNPLFPKGAYFNESGLTSWSNLIAIRPSLGLSPTKAIALEISYLDRARQTGGDAVYLQPSMVLPGSLASRAKAVGRALQADASWQATRNIKLQVQALRQEVDAAVKAAGGRDGDFVMGIVQYRF
jgi:opacity protein-like surface antigen